MVESTAKLIKFLINDLSADQSKSDSNFQELLSLSQRQITRDNLTRWWPILREFSSNIRDFGLIVFNKLIEKSTTRVLRATADAIFGPSENEKILV